MSEQPTGKQSSDRDAWREVAVQFEELGRSLAQAIRTGWESEANRKRMQEVRSGLETMAGDVARAIDEAASSPEGQKVLSQAERAARSAKVAGQQAFEDVQPQIVSALQQVNAGLQKWVDQMRAEAKPEGSDSQPKPQ